MASRLDFLRWGPFVDAKGWLRGLAISIGAALFMSYVEAFGSGRAALPIRLTYWLGLMIGGYVWGILISRWFFRNLERGPSVWWRVAGSSVVLAIPFSVVVRYASMWAFHARIPWDEFPGLILSVIAVTFVVIALNVLVDRRAEGVTGTSATPAKFLERLPLKLKDADLWAVEAEDHYLRLHTSKGQDLILMRLSDAIPELEGLEGAQVHRSWWIARAAIADAKRGDGRATVTLKDGAEVPVSRTYAGMLRERGWI